MIGSPAAGFLASPVFLVAGYGSGTSVAEMVATSGPVAKAVLLILLAFSIVSWAIITQKYLLFRKIKRQSAAFLTVFFDQRNLAVINSEAKRYGHSPLARMFVAGYRKVRSHQRTATAGNPHGVAIDEDIREPASVNELLEELQNTLARVAAEEVARLERALTFLGTTGSTTPFIGLFGTVWGVMGAFQGIGARGSTSIGVVAPGIAEALIATAAGLAAAIPAVIAYNYYVNRVKASATQMDSFADEFLGIVRRAKTRGVI
jgi:biopolymer transport protein TolQ